MYTRLTQPLCPSPRTIDGWCVLHRNDHRTGRSKSRLTHTPPLHTLQGCERPWARLLTHRGLVDKSRWTDVYLYRCPVGLWYMWSHKVGSSATVSKQVNYLRFSFPCQAEHRDAFELSRVFIKNNSCHFVSVEKILSPQRNQRSY